MSSQTMQLHEIKGICKFIPNLTNFSEKKFVFFPMIFTEFILENEIYLEKDGFGKTFIIFDEDTYINYEIIFTNSKNLNLRKVYLTRNSKNETDCFISSKNFLPEFYKDIPEHFLNSQIRKARMLSNVFIDHNCFKGFYKKVLNLIIVIELYNSLGHKFDVISEVVEPGCKFASIFEEI